MSFWRAFGFLGTLGRHAGNKVSSEGSKAPGPAGRSVLRFEGCVLVVGPRPQGHI